LAANDTVEAPSSAVVLPEMYVTSARYVFTLEEYGVLSKLNTEYTCESYKLLILKNPLFSDCNQFVDSELCASVVLKNNATVFDDQFVDSELNPALNVPVVVTVAFDVSGSRTL
jgi:hypothetical protein